MEHAKHHELTPEEKKQHKAAQKKHKEDKKYAEYKKRKDKTAKKNAEGKSNIINEFKTFISRGNVINLAVGVIIAGAFTAIVNALVTNILMPCINWLLPPDMQEIQTIFRYYHDGSAISPVTDPATGVETWPYVIGWGVLINAIITFFLVALILFIALKVFTTVRDAALKNKKLMEARDALENPPAPEPVTVTNEDIVNVLVEIRDSLKHKPVHHHKEEHEEKHKDKK